MEPHYPAPGAVDEEEPQVEPHYPAPGGVEGEELTKEEPPYPAPGALRERGGRRKSCPIQPRSRWWRGDDESGATLASPRSR